MYDIFETMADFFRRVFGSSVDPEKEQFVERCVGEWHRDVSSCADKFLKDSKGKVDSTLLAEFRRIYEKIFDFFRKLIEDEDCGKFEEKLPKGIGFILGVDGKKKKIAKYGPIKNDGARDVSYEYEDRDFFYVINWLEGLKKVVNDQLKSEKLKKGILNTLVKLVELKWAGVDVVIRDGGDTIEIEGDICLNFRHEVVDVDGKHLIIKNAKKIEPLAFCGSGVLSVVIRGDINTIGESAFSRCERLETLKIEGSVGRFDVSSFNECTHLYSIEICGNVGHISNYAFFWCDNLQSLKVFGKVRQIGDGVNIKDEDKDKDKDKNGVETTFRVTDTLKEFSIGNPDDVVLGRGSFDLLDGEDSKFRKTKFYEACVKRFPGAFV